jgi:predicted DNA-binding ribbon-helix-helix protein
VSLKRRSVVIDGHRTSISIEPEFWQALSDIARAQGKKINALIAEIDRARDGNLSSAIRVFVLRAAATRPTSRG